MIYRISDPESKRFVSSRLVSPSLAADLSPYRLVIYRSMSDSDVQVPAVGLLWTADGRTLYLVRSLGSCGGG